MNKVVTVIVLLAFSFSLSSCATTGQTGAGIGATAGGVLGYVLGGKKGAAYGVAIGGLTGYFVGVEVGKAKERKIKTANQIYRQKPKLATVQAKNQPPTLTSMTPVIRNQNQRRINVVKNGEWIDLCTNYQIDIPKYSNTKAVSVKEYNTLIAPDGRKMKSRGLERNVVRECGQIEGAIPVKIPENMPAGKYKHYASVVVNGKKYEKVQEVQIAIVDGKYEVYALN